MVKARNSKIPKPLRAAYRLLIDKSPISSCSLAVIPVLDKSPQYLVHFDAGPFVWKDGRHVKMVLEVKLPWQA